VTPVEFRRDLWQQKTRLPGLSCSVVCVILRLAVLVELRLVTDRRMDTVPCMASTADRAVKMGQVILATPIWEYVVILTPVVSYEQHVYKI